MSELSLPLAAIEVRTKKILIITIINRMLSLQRLKEAVKLSEGKKDVNFLNVNWFSTATTMSEFVKNMTGLCNELSASDANYSIRAGCEIFKGFLRMTTSSDDVNEFKEKLIQKGNDFVSNASDYRRKISEFGLQLIKDDSIILIHSYSRVVMSSILHAASRNLRFKVFVTESQPSFNG
jgi:translation initiation factor 2B subunit (eIF-2B alpha/beta/delta family)